MLLEKLDFFLIQIYAAVVEGEVSWETQTAKKCDVDIVEGEKGRNQFFTIHAATFHLGFCWLFIASLQSVCETRKKRKLIFFHFPENLLSILFQLPPALCYRK